MTTMSNLPKDLAEEVLSRIPLTSLRIIGSTCKKWNTLSKDHNFTKKHLDRQAKVAENEREFMMREAKLISLDDSVEVDVAQVFHYDGLLLCITKDYTKFVVCNPYLGKPGGSSRHINSTDLTCIRMLSDTTRVENPTKS
ncbi:unnamed protein product [Arabidopsis halleri]